MNDQKQTVGFDVLAVGDIVTDAFIKLLDDRAQTYDTEHGPILAMPFGTKIPFDHAEVVPAVGNSPNAAVNFAKLGLKTGLITNVGGDTAGREILDYLEDCKVDTRFVKIHPKKKSNYHYVLWYKEERTILIKHEGYKYHWPHLRGPEKPKWVYFSSISKDALEFHDEMIESLDRHPDIRLAFQPGTFQMEIGAERLAHVYKRTDLLAVNREEAVYITGGKHEDIHDLFDRLHALGPQVVVISDGPNGSYASDGENRYQMPIYPDASPPKERTGAGDAFTSTFVASIIKGNNLEGALQRAPITSMNVVQHVGAQAGLLTNKEIDDFLVKAPDWYKPKRI